MVSVAYLLFELAVNSGDEVCRRQSGITSYSPQMAWDIVPNGELLSLITIKTTPATPYV